MIPKVQFPDWQANPQAALNVPPGRYWLEMHWDRLPLALGALRTMPGAKVEQILLPQGRPLALVAFVLPQAITLRLPQAQKTGVIYRLDDRSLRDEALRYFGDTAITEPDLLEMLQNLDQPSYEAALQTLREVRATGAAVVQTIRKATSTGGALLLLGAGAAAVFIVASKTRRS